MNDLSYRVALCLVAAAGVGMLLTAYGSTVEGTAGYRQVLSIVTGLALLESTLRPAWRLPAISAAATETLTYIGAMVVPTFPQSAAVFGVEAVLLAMLSVAGVVLTRQARREAHWDGALAWRPET